MALIEGRGLRGGSAEKEWRGQRLEMITWHQKRNNGKGGGAEAMGRVEACIIQPERGTMKILHGQTLKGHRTRRRRVGKKVWSCPLSAKRREIGGNPEDYHSLENAKTRRHLYSSVEAIGSKVG